MLKITAYFECVFQLFFQNEILYPSYPGSFHYMPKGLRALEKLIKIIDEEMQNMGALKVSMPTMMEKRLWKKTGRALHKLFQSASKTDVGLLYAPCHRACVSTLLHMYVLLSICTCIMYT